MLCYIKNKTTLNKNMKIKKIPFLLLPLFPVSMAEYTVIYPVSNIKFVNESQWVVTEPLISEWVGSGEYYDCSSELPASNTIDNGKEFEQKLSGCSQDMTRTVQNRERNKDTGDYKNVGTAITETKTDTGLSYTKTSYGTGANESYTISYGAGTIVNSVNKFVGSYARSNLSIDIGTKSTNSDGQRVLIYLSNASGTTCKVNFGVTESRGWTPNTTTNLKTALAFVNKYKYLDFYNADNSLGKRYNISAAGNTTNGDGAYKSLSIPCTEFNVWYNAPTMYSKAVLNTL